MSNYIYNNFDENNNDDNENLNVVYGTTTKKRGASPMLVVCIVLALVSAIIFLFGCLLNFLSTSLDEDLAPQSKPQVNNTISYVSADNESNLALLNDPASRVAVIARIKDSVVEIENSSGSGSGVIVGKFTNSNNQKGYYIITNAHVVENANMQSSSIVTLNDGTEYKSILSGIDSRSDIAVLQIVENQRELTCATWANEENKLFVGEEIIVIGYPLGVLDNTVTNGYLSAIDTNLRISGVEMNLLQIDATVNPGNSGGGLFNRNGELIGIVNAKVVGENAEGIGFAIPYDDAMDVYSDLRDYGYVTGRPTIGIQVKTTRQGNIQVVSAPEDSDLKAGDIIVGIKLPGEAVYSTNITVQSLSDAIYNTKVGETISFKIVRSYRELTVSVKTFEYSK